VVPEVIAHATDRVQQQCQAGHCGPTGDRIAHTGQRLDMDRVAAVVSERSTVTPNRERV